MNTGVKVGDHASPAWHSGKVGIAVLCRHNLSRLELGDTINTYDKIRALARDANVILFTPRGYVSRDLHLLMRIVQVSPPGVRFALALIPALLLHMRDYDCIYSRDPLLMAFAVPMKMFGKVLAIELHGIPSIETEVRRRTHEVRVPRLTSLICRFMRLIETFAIRSADLTMPVTERMRDTLLREYNVNERKITVVPNSVDTELFKPLETGRTAIRRKFGIGRQTVVLYLSTFSTSWRRTDRLFHIADLVRHKRNDIVFLIVGSGPLLEEIKARSREDNTRGRMVFAGAVEYSAVPIYMNGADVYVYDVVNTANKLIQKQGLCPAKILQAMSCGRPVIGPKAPDLETILRNSGGGFSASSLEEVEALIEKFADSPELVNSMGTSGRRYVQMNHDLARLSKHKIELMTRAFCQKRRNADKTYKIDMP